MNIKNTTNNYHRKENTLWKTRTFANRLIQVERESFLEKLNDCNDIEYLKQVIEVCRSRAIYLALKKEGLI